MKSLAYYCCSSLPIWQVFIFTDTILICLVPTSLVHHKWYYLPPFSITNPRTLFLVFHNLFPPCIRPSNVVLSNESCLRIWPNHLFCRLLSMSIISLSVSTICNTSSFVLCSVHDTFIIHLHIHISNASSRRISSFCKVDKEAIRRLQAFEMWIFSVGWERHQRLTDVKRDRCRLAPEQKV